MRSDVCPLCGSADNEKRFTSRSHDLVVCKKCELLFIIPYPSDVESRHAATKHNLFGDLEILNERTHYEAEVVFLGKFFPRIEKEISGANSMLDAGCGGGRLLELVGQSHPNMARTGIELNTQRAKFARERAGCEIHQVPLEKFRSDTPFDVITLMNVLSHILSLDMLFAAVRSLLAEKGKFILKVGEFRFDVTKSAVFEWQIPDHMHFLGLHTIDYICEKYNFSKTAHDRVPLSKELFSRARFLSSGRSRSRNAVKTVFAYTPFAISAMRGLYKMKHGGTTYSSFIVLKKEKGDITDIAAMGAKG